MRTLLSAAVIVLASASVSHAQAQPEKALQDAANARTQAMRSADGNTWGKYTTDDFMVIGADGSTRTKAQRISEINATKPASSAAQAASPDVKWRMYGASTAISTMQTSVEGKPTMITSVFVKQGGVWKVATVQLTNVTK